MMFFSRIWRHFGFYSTAQRTVDMRSPGMAGGLSRVKSGPAHARFFCAALEKTPVSRVEVSPWEKPVGLLWAETGGSSYACHGDSQWAEPGGNRGSQIGWADKRCSHTPTVVSPSETLNTEQAVQFFLTITCKIGSRSLTGHCHSHQSGGDSGMCFFSHHELFELCQMRTTFVPWLCNF